MNLKTSLVLLTAYLSLPASNAFLWDWCGCSSRLDEVLANQDSCSDSIGALQSTVDVAMDSIISAASTTIEPFAETTEGGICDVAGSAVKFPTIIIRHTPTDGYFVVTSIIIGTDRQAPGEGYTALRTNRLSIDGESIFDMISVNIMGWDVGGSTTINESADLMGMPIILQARSGLTDDPPTGGNFPNQIVASSSIRIQLLCSAPDHNLSIQSVRVSGWKMTGHNVTVEYAVGT